GGERAAGRGTVVIHGFFWLSSAIKLTRRVPSAQTERWSGATRPVDPSFFAVGTHRPLFHTITEPQRVRDTETAINCRCFSSVPLWLVLFLHYAQQLLRFAEQELRHNRLVPFAPGWSRAA